MPPVCCASNAKGGGGFDPAGNERPVRSRRGASAPAAEGAAAGIENFDTMDAPGIKADVVDIRSLPEGMGLDHQCTLVHIKL